MWNHQSAGVMSRACVPLSNGSYYPWRVVLRRRIWLDGRAFSQLIPLIREMCRRIVTGGNFVDFILFRGLFPPENKSPRKELKSCSYVHSSEVFESEEEARRRIGSNHILNFMTMDLLSPIPLTKCRVLYSIQLDLTLFIYGTETETHCTNFWPIPIQKYLHEQEINSVIRYG